jgi:hypothetical protein
MIRVRLISAGRLGPACASRSLRSGTGQFPAGIPPSKHSRKTTAVTSKTHPGHPMTIAITIDVARQKYGERRDRGRLPSTVVQHARCIILQFHVQSRCLIVIDDDEFVPHLVNDIPTMFLGRRSCARLIVKSQACKGRWVESLGTLC